MTDDLQQYVDQKVSSGQFSSKEQFLAETVRVYRKIETEYDQFRDDIQEQIQKADSGDLAPVDIESLKQELIDNFNEDGTPK